ncbi:hypothetical protein DXG01_011091 [Tephrocybe rancida]|nr:hypothetical protein DXG01_011091 [Tephrocybe rancida]
MNSNALTGNLDNAAFGSVGNVADRHHSNGYRSVSKSHSPPKTYGSVDAHVVNRSTLTSSPERIRPDSTLLDVVPEDRIVMEFSPDETRTPRYTAGAPLDDDEETEEWELDQELEEQGLYRGSYRRLVLLYTLIPITFVVVFSMLAALPYVLYPMNHDWPYPSVPYFQHPFPELLASASLFSLSHLLRDPIITIATSIFPSPSAAVPTVLATALHTLVSLTLQQSALPLLQVTQNTPPRPTTHDGAFRRVWWLALGWAATEAIIGICQGYQARSHYRDVLVTVRRTAETPSTKADGPEVRPMGPVSSATSRSPVGGKQTATGQSTLELFERQVEDDVYGGDRGGPQPFGEEQGERQPLLPPPRVEEQAIKLLVEDELEELLAIRARDELEDAYGIPVIHIPVFISCLQRINDLLLALGVSLLLAQAYLRSSLARGVTTPSHALVITAPIVWAIRCYLSLLHTPLVLPRMGVPAVVYTASLISLSTFFAGLGMWEGVS